MLKLRKILLCNYIYYIIFLLIAIITFIRLLSPKESIYNEKSSKFQGIVTKIIIKNEKITLYIKNKETIIATYYQKNNKKIYLNLGDKIYIKGTFKRPTPNTTKYLFNYKKYLERKNIFYSVEVNSLKKIENNKNIYYLIKQKLLNHLNNNPYLNTFILGDKTYLSDNIKRSYSENGISHLFAISGMHITLLASIINKILARLKLSEASIFKATTTILLAYLLLVGMSPSITRGVLFYIIFSLNRIYYFYIKPLNLFLLILSITLLINPYNIFDIGFQYSFLISLTLLLKSKELNENNYFLSLIKVSYTSFLISLPITLFNFYQLNILSIIYNLFFVPLISIIIFPLSLLVTIFPPLIKIFNTLTIFLEKSSLFLNHISIGKMIFKRIPSIFYFLYLLIISLYLKKHKKSFLIIFLISLSIHYLLPYFDRTTYLKMIDIGQGDCILLHSHNKNVLIDTGGASSFNNDADGKIFYNIISPVLKSQGIKKLDYLILTHGDKDHLGEAKTIISNIPVDKIIINANKINYYEQEILNKNTIIGTEGLTFKLKDLTFIELGTNLDDENDSSQIYLVGYKNIKILLTGDASVKSEEEMLSKYNLGKINILKVGHHGSKTSTSEYLLKEIEPDIALISSGRDNKFNHPHQEVISRLKKHNTKIYNTKNDGTVTLDLDKLIIKCDN